MTGGQGAHNEGGTVRPLRPGHNAGAETGSAQAPVSTEPTPVTRKLSDVESERVRWLWQDRIPLGKLTTLDGDPAVGKSTLMADVTARVTTGAPWPDATSAERRLPSTVVWMTAEDGIADTLRPRLEAAGGDASRVVVLDAIQVLDEDGKAFQRPPVLPGDLNHLAAVITAAGASLVIVDVLVAYLDPKVDAHKDQSIRRVLAQLARLAEDTRCAIVALRHLNKATGLSVLYRGGGSIGIIGQARSGMLVAPDPADATGERRILAGAKNNLGPLPPALAYRLVSDERWGCARVVWEGRTDHLAADLLATTQDTDDDRPDRDAALGWLHEVLSEGPMLADEVKALARKAGFSARTIERARGQKGSGVTTKREGFGRGSSYRWALAGDPCSPPAAHVRHVRQPSASGEHGEHGDWGGEHGGTGVVDAGRYEADYPDLFDTEGER